MMPVSPVETFETDITEEIKQKQGFVTDVLAAHSSSPPKTPDQTIIRTLTFAIVFLLIALVVGIWYYFSVKNQQATEKIEQQKTIVVKKPAISINNILPKTASNIDRFVLKTTRENAGYIITLSDYTSVYGNIINNETLFGNELISLFQINTHSAPVFRDVTINNQDMRVATLVVISDATSTTMTPTVNTLMPPTIPTASTTKSTSSKTTSLLNTSTSTKKSSSTTTPVVATTTTPKTPEVVPDINTSFEYVSYGFIGTSTLIISTSQEKLLELRSAIIK